MKWKKKLEVENVIYKIEENNQLPLSSLLCHFSPFNIRFLFLTALIFLDNRVIRIKDISGKERLVRIIGTRRYVDIMLWDGKEFIFGL